LRKYSVNPKQRSAEQKCEEDIQRYGLHILKVADGNNWAEYAYTVGLFQTYGHPEAIVLGLPGDVAHGVLNCLADVIRSGKQFAPGEQTEDLLEGYPCKFLEIPFEQMFAHFGWAIWYYDDRAFPVWQLVYPDRAGRWPWEPGVSPGFISQQPVLSKVPVSAWAIR
jgi:hypothetical protein